MVRGKTHYRLAALAGANVGCGEPFDFLLDRHGSAPEYRHADDPRVEPEAEHKIEERAGDDHDEVVTKTADFCNGWRRDISPALDRDAIVDRPGQNRAEQDDRAEI